MRILIAEDDGVTRQVLARTLQKWGYEVVVACDGDQAWEIVQGADAPFLMVLDWLMPGIDGVDLCAKLRTLDREIRPYIILLTGMNHKQDLIEGFNAGADDYVMKPCDLDELRVRIRAGEKIIDLQIESLAARDALRKLATYDFLTGLRNRAAIESELGREIERAPRTGQPVSVVMADIDHFKQVNDVYGHLTGDRVLAEVAKRMAGAMRSYEAIGRYGGEEFLMVITGSSPEGAIILAERVRNAVSSRKFDILGQGIHVTISLGVAACQRVDAPPQESLIALADSALYRAKEAGRNRVALVDAHGENVLDDASMASCLRGFASDDAEPLQKTS
ncbi:MAG: diguanylate cyclase [Planctomycetia bacterium]|nr:diguanylate cyclase [Planctomycetia bacterium]